MGPVGGDLGAACLPVIGAACAFLSPLTPQRRTCLRKWTYKADISRTSSQGYRIDDIAPGLAAALRPLANKLDLLETERLYMDGGQSVRRILDKLHDLTERLQALISDKDK